MRLIDADELIDDLSDLKRSPWANESWASDQRKLGIREALDMIQSIVRIDSQTVDAAPVVHGRWIAHTMSEITGYDPALSGDDPVCTYSCSVCGEDCYVSDTGDDILSNYCPNCGADMRG